MLVTSRRRLASLEDAVPVSLPVLPAAEAATLFVRVADADPGEADTMRLVELCGGLPLAIRLVAARLRHHPTWSGSDLIGELTAASSRIASLSAEDVSVAAAFDLSYRDVTVEARDLFRLLGLHPGIDFDAAAVAALLGDTASSAGRLLADLEDHHLVEEAAFGRYRMHDLLREYARSLAETIEQHQGLAAVERVLDYYQSVAASANARLSRHTKSTATATPAARAFLDRDEAHTWMRTERPNLLAMIRYATRKARNAQIVTLTSGIAGLLRNDGPWSLALSLHAGAVRAARAIGDRPGEAEALVELGATQWSVGDYPGATESLRDARAAFEALGDRLGEANALNNMAVVLQLGGDRTGAAQAYEQALERFRDTGDLLGEAGALNNRAILRFSL